MSVTLLVGLAGIILIAFIVAMVLALRRRRQAAELQQHFHSAYDERARWNSLEDAEDPIDQ
jgi:Flp pilus assembly protein TadB